MSGLTAATLQSSRNSPVVRDWFIIMVMASTIASLNFNRHWVLQGFMIQVVGFIFLIMLSISSLSSGRKPLELEHLLWYDFCVFWSQNCSLIFFICLGRNLQICLVGKMEIQLLALNLHPLPLLVIWEFCTGFYPYFHYHLVFLIYVFSWSDVGASYILSWYVYNLLDLHVI